MSATQTKFFDQVQNFLLTEVMERISLGLKQQHHVEVTVDDLFALIDSVKPVGVKVVEKKERKARVSKPVTPVADGQRCQFRFTRNGKHVVKGERCPNKVAENWPVCKGCSQKVSSDPYFASMGLEPPERKKRSKAAKKPAAEKGQGPPNPPIGKNVNALSGLPRKNTQPTEPNLISVASLGEDSDDENQ